MVPAGAPCDVAAGAAFGFRDIFLDPVASFSNIGICGVLTDAFSTINGNGKAIGLVTIIPGSGAGTSFFGGNNFINSGTIGGVVSLNGHGLTKACQCDNVCPVSTTSGANCAGGYVIAKSGGGSICVKFGAGLALPNADSATATAMFPLGSDHLTVTIDETVVSYNFGAVATANAGTQLVALLLFKTGPPKQGVFFSACGPFIVESTGGKRKRAPETAVLSLGIGVLQAASASGDPHLVGANGITFDVYGAPAANYSLLAAPAFEINMQLADRGPEMRFMTAMAVLYKGKSFTITPWTVKAGSAELIAHFAALGAKASINVQEWAITIELCALHTIVFHTRHEGDINFLNFEVRVPGCHDAYGGLLGQTYQCKYAHESFNWSREREEAFRVPTLDSPSGSYSPLVDCAHEDEYRGEAIRGGSFSNSTLSMTTML